MRLPAEVFQDSGTVQILLTRFLAVGFVFGSPVLRVEIMPFQRFHFLLKRSFDASAGFVDADHMIQKQIAKQVFRDLNRLDKTPFRVARDARVAIWDIEPI